MARLGGPEPHGRRSGVVHVTTVDDAALIEARRLATLPGDQGRLNSTHMPVVADAQHDLAAAMPAEATEPTTSTHSSRGVAG